AVDQWVAGANDPLHLCEARWIQESFRRLDGALLDRILASDEYRARAAAVHTISNEYLRLDDVLERLAAAIEDPHPRVRVEALRGLSFLGTVEAAEVALRVHNQPMDYYLEY